MKTGTLVKVYHKGVGVIVDRDIHHNGDWKYLILFISDGYRAWWTENHLEVICE